VTLEQENPMTTQISAKFAALAIALTMNFAMIGGIAYLFNGPTHQSSQFRLAVLDLAAL
jgi:hypothetical protein